MTLEPSLAFWLSAVLAVLLVGISKGGFGGGVGVAATPILALTMSVAEAAALLLPLLIAADVVAVYTYRHRFSRPHLRLLLPWAALGVGLGALVFRALESDERLLRLFIGLVALGFLLYQGVRGALLRRLDGPLGRGWAMPLGMLSGFGSTLAHVGGPPATIYLLPQRLPRDVFVGTNAVFFFVLNVLKLLPYALLGLLSPANLSVTLLLAPLVPVGVLLGAQLNRIVSERAFAGIVYGLLLVTGLELTLGVSLLGWLLGRGS